MRDRPVRSSRMSRLERQKGGGRQGQSESKDLGFAIKK